MNNGLCWVSTLAYPNLLGIKRALLMLMLKNAGDDKSPGSARIKPRRHDSYVSQHWQRMKERWTVPAEPPLTHQDSFPVLGMLILEKLASDPDNCAEIGRATDLISKI